MKSEDEVVQHQPQVQYAPTGQPVAAATGGMNWMPLTVQAPVGCPPGLEYLTTLDQLIVKQQIELFEGASCRSEVACRSHQPNHITLNVILYIFVGFCI